jgi:phosphoribosylamine--glycine ligase
MKILVIGGGGREHALVWKLSQSPLVREIVAAPGNPGIAARARCVSTLSAADVPGLLALARKERFDLTVVGPEAPLVDGIADEFEKEGLAILGPTRRAAEIEGSKVFAKQLLERHGIPSSRYAVFSDFATARAHIEAAPPPLVIKADGLAAGKGVIVARDRASALDAARAMLVEGTFGPAGARLVVEEYLEGEEASVLVLTDGRDVVTLIPAQDHKPVLDGDQGPNTGGMGSYAPAPLVNRELLGAITGGIIEPTLRALREDGREYRGVLYAGVMVTASGPKVLEFNCRFGDPETQALLPLLDVDLAELCLACATGSVSGKRVAWKPGYAVCVVLASGGYPGPCEKGLPIFGLGKLRSRSDVVAFHAGTVLEPSPLAGSRPRTLTAGGRVLGITGWGETLPAAIDTTYEGVSEIRFQGMHYRRDIGVKALRRLSDRGTGDTRP